MNEDKNMIIKQSFDYILRLEDAIAKDVKIPYGDHSGRFFTRKDFIEHLKFAYSKLHESLGE